MLLERSRQPHGDRKYHLPIEMASTSPAITGTGPRVAWSGGGGAGCGTAHALRMAGCGTAHALRIVFRAGTEGDGMVMRINKKDDARVWTV